ncbi:MAG: HNH endonuclease [Planctomycetota bacterium]|jgi:hypothetical protein
MRLMKGLSEKRLLSRIQRMHRMVGVGERLLGFYLLDFEERRLYLKQGCVNTVHFALLKLHIPTKKTRELLRVARALEHLPLIDCAYSEGRISWSAVRELTRVAVQETEAEWLYLAEESTLRKIEHAVSRAAHGELPPRDPYGLPKTRLKVVAELAMEDYAVWKAAFDRLAEGCGQELDTSTALTLLAQKFLEQPLKKQEKESRKAYQVVYHRCSDCDRAWIQADEGPVGIAPAKVSEREPDAMAIHLNDDHPGELQDVPRGTSHLESPWVPVEERDKPNTPLIRQQVLSRDGHRCATPGCTNQGGLMAHHVIWKAHGGRTRIQNEISICQRCHGLIHEGLMQVEGCAPHDLIWRGPEGKSLEAPWDGALPGGQYVPRGTPSDATAVEDESILSLDQIPDSIDSAWWRRHGHHFEFKGRRLKLKNAL